MWYAATKQDTKQLWSICFCMLSNDGIRSGKQVELYTTMHARGQKRLSWFPVCLLCIESYPLACVENMKRIVNILFNILKKSLFESPSKYTVVILELANISIACSSLSFLFFICRDPETQRIELFWLHSKLRCLKGQLWCLYFSAWIPWDLGCPPLYQQWKLEVLLERRILLVFCFFL